MMLCASPNKGKRMKYKKIILTLIVSILLVGIVILAQDVKKGDKAKVETPVKAGKTFKSKTGIELISIPAGEFMMGCSDGDIECYDWEKPAHKVKITKGFYMGKYEVTQGQWKAVIGENPSALKDCGDNCPVENVNWDDVKVFLVKLNAKEGRTGKRIYRLPTEAEWEYAARAGTTTNYYWGDKLSSGFLGFGAVGQDYLWYDDNSSSMTHPVGQKKANGFGLYDMSGNVAELVEDWYDRDYYSSASVSDPQGAANGFYRVVRGGYWGSDGQGCRSFDRFYSSPDDPSALNGLRVVLIP
jgi:formylglycine-generating enzyme required for sulfatase activity